MSETMAYDVVIVGGGPAGLSTAIRLKQLQDSSSPISVCVLEKGSAMGAHSLSGAVIDPRALDELLPHWRREENPLNVEVQEDEFFFLTKGDKWSLPVPPPLKNKGHYITRMGIFCQWLAEKAQAMGVEIYPGFPAAEFVFDSGGRVSGVITQPKGVGSDGHPTERYQPGVKLTASFTVLAEGCRGSLSQKAIHKYGLDKSSDPQTYALGLKELWEVKSFSYYPGQVTHTIGWPLDFRTYGGSFVYHLAYNLVSVGFVVGLDYENPYLNPFEEFQRLKHHPFLSTLLQGGKRIAYGARALNEGGFQSIPKLTFPGGLLVGCAAGFMNVPKIKGTHTAMKSGIVAAEALYQALKAKQKQTTYQESMEKSWVWEELRQVRNIRPAFQKGLWTGMANAALESFLLKGRGMWTLRHTAPDHEKTKPARAYQKIIYPKPDGLLSFDKLSSVHMSNTHHEENQPCHLRLKEASGPLDVNLPLYDGLEERYCPAGVYEYIEENGHPQLKIHSQNCLHCKTCDIKDPRQNIEWTPPEGGGGPNYTGL